MLRWLDPRKSSSAASKRGVGGGGGGGGECVTDDPFAVIDTGFAHNKIYSVSRVNPLFVDVGDAPPLSPPPPKQQRGTPPSSSSRRRSSSSGYASVEQLGALLERNPAFVRSIAVATGRSHFGGGSTSGGGAGGGANSSSGGGTLTTIPEGRVDQPVPRPIWPDKAYDSLVDDALLLYTSLSHESGGQASGGGLCDGFTDLPVKDLLLELLNGINETLEGRNGTTPEDMLKAVDEKIRLKLELLRHSTEEEMRRLCVNLGNCRKKNSVLRALSNSSSSGNSSSKSCPASEAEELYQAPSGSSSSGFSDSPPKGRRTALPDFVGVPNVVRNAMIYGTLCRHKGGAGEGLLMGGGGGRIGAVTQPKKSLLTRADDKPSVWEQYYGVRAVEEGEVKYHHKPADVPVFPGGRPEADFTLDLPRSEHLMKRMKQDKKWRCRCRLLASFLGLIFFLLSVMAVSLMLTRGKRMFGSMV